MGDQKPAKPSAKAVKEAETTWSSFMAISKVSTYLIIGILVALYFAFIAF